MPFDLSPWGFVRPAIHCNVVIFKFISEKSLASSLPERDFLSVSLSGEIKTGGEKRESEAPVGVQILACAAGAAARWGKASVEAAEAPGAFEAKAAGASLGRQEGLPEPVWGFFPAATPPGPWITVGSLPDAPGSGHGAPSPVWVEAWAPAPGKCRPPMGRRSA